MRKTGTADPVEVPLTDGAYVVTAADAGASFTAVSTGQRPDAPAMTGGAGVVSFDPVTATSAPVTVAAGADEALKSTGAPKIAGTAKVGQTLTATAGSWNWPDVAVKYQWLRGGKPVAGATSASYPLSVTDAGRKISVRVAGTSPGHGAADATSAVVRVAKAASVTKIRVKPKRPSHKKLATINVAVLVRGLAAPVGKVRIVRAKTVLRTIRLTAKNRGKVSIKMRLPVGKRPVVARYLGSGATLGSRSKPAPVTVV
jgi:hypothetical protein